MRSVAGSKTFMVAVLTLKIKVISDCFKKKKNTRNQKVNQTE